MSDKKRKSAKLGEVHKKSRQRPVCQKDVEVDCDAAANKPDFDKKDSSINPQRKPPGPDKPTRRSRSSSRDVKPDNPRPEVRIRKK
jgi:hypothetical protein